MIKTKNMKTKEKKTLGLLALLIALCMPLTISCSTNSLLSPPIETNESAGFHIVGTWDMAGYGNSESYTKHPYGYLTLRADSTLYGWGLNEMIGTYEIEGEKATFKYGKTKRLSDHDFLDIYLNRVTRYKLLDSDHLRLYYSDDDYMELTRRAQ